MSTKSEQTLGNKHAVLQIHNEEHNLEWNNITYEIKNKTETRQILSHVTGSVKSGEMLGIMGPSGCK